MSKKRQVKGEAAQGAAVSMLAEVGRLPTEISEAILDNPAQVTAQVDTEPVEVQAAIAALPQEALLLCVLGLACGWYMAEGDTIRVLVTAAALNVGGVAGGADASSRIKIRWARALLNAALDGDLDDVLFVEDPRFGFQVPTTCQGVPDNILQPRDTWHDKETYDNVANLLAQMFIENFEQYAEGCSEEVLASSPKVLV